MRFLLYQHGTIQIVNIRTNRVFDYTPWILGFAVLVIPTVLWFHFYRWDPPVQAFALFPLLGVWAWSLMWTHYVYGAMRLRWSHVFPENNPYNRITAWLVLLLILLHPFLLAWEQKQRTQLLPPESFLAYVPPEMELFITFGTIGLLLFLAYEVFGRLRQRSIFRRNWLWVSLSQVLAMTLIFVHGLQIGQTVLAGWGSIYWTALGLVLIPALVVVVREDWRTQQEARQDGAVERE